MPILEHDVVHLRCSATKKVLCSPHALFNVHHTPFHFHGRCWCAPCGCDDKLLMCFMGVSRGTFVFSPDTLTTYYWCGYVPRWGVYVKVAWSRHAWQQQDVHRQIPTSSRVLTTLHLIGVLGGLAAHGILETRIIMSALVERGWRWIRKLSLKCSWECMQALLLIATALSIEIFMHGVSFCIHNPFFQCVIFFVHNAVHFVYVYIFCIQTFVNCVHFGRSHQIWLRSWQEEATGT